MEDRRARPAVGASNAWVALVAMGVAAIAASLLFGRSRTFREAGHELA